MVRKIRAKGQDEKEHDGVSERAGEAWEYQCLVEKCSACEASTIKTVWKPLESWWRFRAQVFVQYSQNAATERDRLLSIKSFVILIGKWLMVARQTSQNVI